MTNVLRILILEDNKNDVDLLQHELKKSGLSYVSELVQTEKAFEDAVRNFQPDIVLSDYSLPGFDGVSAFKIKQRISARIPFIIVSGTVGEERAVSLIKDGITDYVLKDKLFSLTPKINRALKDAKREKERDDTYQKLQEQNEKLFEIAVLQSHQVRAPIAHILGLFNLFQFDNPTASINGEVLIKLKTIAESLEKLTVQIVQKTLEIENKVN
jgi:DNA-binding NtrC family response regulator